MATEESDAVRSPSSSEESFVVIDPVELFTTANTETFPDDNSTTEQKQLSPISKRTEPLSLQGFRKFLDPDGRLVEESALRKAVFLGGVDPVARREVWQYLFGLYPCSSTRRERETLLMDYILQYHEMKSRWKTLLVASSPPGATQLEQGLVARYQIEESQQPLHSPDFNVTRNADATDDAGCTQAYLISGPEHDRSQADARPDQVELDFSALAKNEIDIDLNSNETKQRVEFMKIQAQVYVNRHKIDSDEIRSHLRLIDKDVPRTDRDYGYFNGPNNPHLSMLRDILITFSAFHPTVGYAQGMNDILARFLVVFDSEVEAYWCFHKYLEKIENDFMEAGMMQKIGLVQKLLLEMDPKLLEHLERHDLGDLIFCHRWLLLGFKREFSFLDSLRVFEMLSSHHLELSSLEAETARRRQQMKEFADIGGVTRTTQPDTEFDFTFELFMCVALLEQMRPSLLKCTDAAMVYDCMNKLEINLDSVLEKSEHIFFRYCKKNVEDSFLMVDSPTR